MSLAPTQLPEECDREDEEYDKQSDRGSRWVTGGMATCACTLCAFFVLAAMFLTGRVGCRAYAKASIAVWCVGVCVSFLLLAKGAAVMRDYLADRDKTRPPG